MASVGREPQDHNTKNEDQTSIPEDPSNNDYNISQPIHPTTGLRSSLTSYGDAHFSLFLRKVFIKALGYSEDALSRPIIGIINTYSGFNPCHGNIPQLLEAAKRGILLNGGLPVEFPTISVHESFASPTSMFLRNLMSIDTEEMIRAQPVDAVLMIGGCDKTVPAQLMGGISANKPIVSLVTGPMLTGSVRGTRVGACTDCRSNWAAYRAGTLDIEDIKEVNDELAPTVGTCGVMGTASTMACVVAALGLMPLAGASASAVSATRLRIAEQTGSIAVRIANEKIDPQSLLTISSFHNAITVLQAIGGSTNAIVHILAIANRHPQIEGKITLQTIDDIGRKTPLVVDLKPSGDNYMTDFHNAGGMLALMHTLKPLLHQDAMTITGKTLGETLASTPFKTFPFSIATIRPLDSPIYPNSSLISLKGNLCPRGAVMKASACSPQFLSHTGPALVFTSPADMAARIDSPDLPVTASTVLILQSIGPIGHPGMPEAGLIPIPRKLGRIGVKDMLRISDGRMSGTAGGTVVLHVSPESCVDGSVFGVVRDGDLVCLDAGERKLTLQVDDAEIKRRIDERRTDTVSERVGEGTGKGERGARRGYRRLYERCVLQADEGADFDFLTASGPGPKTRD